MNSVMVGMFESRTAANDARNKLLATGFAKTAVVVSDEAAAATSTAARPAATGERHEEEGAISRFFGSIFGSDDDRDGYGDTCTEAIRRGHYGVSVSTASDDEMDRAEKILNDCGAVDVDERSQQWRTEGWTGGNRAAGDQSLKGANPLKGGDTSKDGDTRTFDVVEEKLKVGKRAVARGGVRVFSRIVEAPVEETVHLRKEHADVQRRTVDRAATEADLAAFKEGSVEVREMSEEAVVNKDARVVGEVEIGKTVTERDETVRDTVRKTEVDVEQIDPQTQSKKSRTYTKPAKPL